jgi:MFS transporter, DHA2 family, multidrug resistance protein
VSAPRAGRREWLGLAALAPACLLTVMDLAVLVLAVPELTADLQPSPVELLWITDIYGFLIAGALITMGTLGDRIGRRRLLLAGSAAFGLTSLLAAYSTSPEMLIVARALQGIAGATLVPCAMSLLFAMFLDERQRGVALGVMMACFAAGAALGPVLGGVLLSSFWWGSVFLVNVPVMVLLLVVGPRLLPEYRAPHAGRLDLVSAALSVVAVLGAIYGIKRAAQDGMDGVAAAAIAAGVLVAIAFVRRQARLSDPLIDLSMFRSPRFSVGLGIASLAAFVMYGLYLLSTEFMQLVLGLSPLEAGLWLLPSAFAVAAGSNLAPQLVRWIPPPLVVAGGLTLMAAGFAALTRIEPGSPLALVIAASVVIHLGVGPVTTLLMGMIIGAAPPERAGAASALSHTGNEFGGALGLGLLGSLVTAIYRHDTGTTGAFADVEGLRVGALQTAERAIAHGFEVAAFACAGLLAGALLLALAVLRRPARRESAAPATASP